MFRYLICLSLLSCGILSYTTQSSSACNRDDRKCLTSLFEGLYATVLEEASPDSVDPMFQKQINATLPSLVFTLTNTTIKGFKSCEIKDASLTSDKISVHLAMFCPRFEITGQYEADGYIKTLLFKGKGDFTLNADSYDVSLDLKLATTDINGERYTKIVDFELDAELQGDLDFTLGNLHNGNKVLSDTTHEFIREHPKVVMSLLQKPVFYANMKKLVEAFNKGLEHIPVGGFIA